MLGGVYNKYYSGVGNSTGVNGMPPQALTKGQKTKKWEKQNLDFLEREAENQFLQNLEYKQYYDMISGRVAYSDITDQPISLLNNISSLREYIDLPTNIEHFDFLGPIFHYLAGTWSMMNDRFSFASVDEVSTNEYMRAHSDLMLEYTKKTFELEKNKRLIKMGFPIKEEFQSEEEQQQYMQELEKQVQDLFPERKEQELRSNFKTEAAQWAEDNYERDKYLYELKDMEYGDAMNIMVMGVAPRHIHIGHDYYKVEDWDPIETFYARDKGLKNIEDAQYAGRITQMSTSEFIDRYGHKISFNQQKEIANSFWEEYTPSDKTITAQEVANGKLYDPRRLPFQGADDLEMTLKFQDALGIPLGMEGAVEEYAEGPDGETYVTKAGQEKMVWLHGGDNWDYSPYSALYSNITPGVTTRQDTIQVTEAYWKGLKWMGILFIETTSGSLDVIEVDENLLSDYIKENDIKKIRTKSISEALKNPEKNTLVPYFQPIVYKGIKVNKKNTKLKDHIYIVEKLDFQIKGSQSNIYNKRLPVTSIVTEPLAPKLKPFQKGYDFEINKLLSLSEKELGTFFIFDINFLPTEFIDLDADAENALTQLYNLAKTFGIMPVDVSKHNTVESGGVPFNPLMQQNISFAQDMQACMVKANFFKQQAMDLIGVNPTVMGSPGKYETAEGIQVSQNATFAQTENIFSKFFADKLRKIQTHVTVAQYCKINDIDSTYMYQASGGEMAFLHAIKDDKYFALRDISVVPLADPNKIKDFETAKNILIQKNTTGADELAFVELMASDDMMELKKAARRARMYQMQREQLAREDNQLAIDKQLAFEKEKEDREYKYKYAALDNKIETERIEALGRAADNMEGTGGVDSINKESDRALKKEMHEDNIKLQNKRIEKEDKAKFATLAYKMEELALKKEKNDIERQKIQTSKFNSIINKN